MLTYSIPTEAGGTGKTTTAINLARAHADAGHDVLLVDLDSQNVSATWFLGDVEWAKDQQHPCLSKIIMGLGSDASLTDIVVAQEEEGFDLLPRHVNDSNFESYYRKAESMAQMEGREFEPCVQLRDQIARERLHTEYDVIIYDVDGSANLKLNQALAASQNVVVPFTVSEKGQSSVGGIRESLNGIESDLGISMTVSALVPNMVDYSSVQECKIAARIIDSDEYTTPIAIGDRATLEKMANGGGSLRSVIADGHGGEKHERTADRYDILAAYLERKANLSDREVDTETPPYYDRIQKYLGSEVVA
ncbi:ParA family protein [Halobaculum sp. MBLA0147]|uniref:ParA family protein n=1 Tax=Halobaculum sp. MBLA0147 TaxID=3079934 RepID=UPI003526255C